MDELRIASTPTLSSSSETLPKGQCVRSPHFSGIAPERRCTDGLWTMLEPSDLSSLAKIKESITFARAYFHTWIRDRVEPHHALSGAGDFAHFIVNPLYEWYGHNKRILTSQPLRRVCLKEAQKQNSTISFINCSSYNYVGTYSMSQGYEWLQRRCLDTLPIANAAAVGLMHSALEAEIASHFGAEYCVTAATGYQANVVTLTAILDKSWVVILDEKSHSSLFTATHLSQVGMRKKFKHNDMADLNKVLDEVTGHLPNIMVVVEGVYSLDGDMPDLAALHVLKQRYLFTLYCDEAHSFLSLGRSGQGCLEMWNDLNPDALLPHTLIDIRTAGISKAILALGGFVCATKRFAEKLRSKSDEFHQRGECLATPAILQALWVLSRPLQLQASISRLREISRFCHKELRRAGIFVYGNDFSPILPLYAGRPSKASELSYVLRKHGVVAVPFSKPAVPLWQSRVRIGLSAGFTDDDVNQLLKAIILSCNETDISRGNCRTNLRTLESFQSRRSMTENLSLEDEARSSLKTLHDMVDRQIVGLPASVDVHFSASPYFTISKEAVLAAGHHARVQYGLGAGGSRWTMGTYMPHIEVEALVSAMSCQQETLTYPESDTGLMSTIAALCRPIKDAREHYFLVPREAPLAVEDGFRAASRSSGTQRITYTDPEDLIASVEKLSKLRHANYITIYQSARNQGKCYQDFSHWTLLLRFRAAFTGMTMLVDDSTGLRDSRIGIVGTVDINAFASLLKARIIIYGSFFHSLGFNGAYLTGDAAVISELRYTSRCYVFTAAPPPYMFAMIKTVLLDRMEIMPLLNE